MALLFENAAKVKNAIMASQQKEIAKLYNDWANDIAERAKFYSHKTTASSPLSERYYKELYKQMKETSKHVSDEAEGIIKRNMYTIADSVVADNVKWLQDFGFSPDGLNVAFSYVPHDVVQMLITGQVYQGGWNLSQRIWSDNQQTQKDVYQIMARGLAENKSIYSIAKDLESYVRPGAKKPWNKAILMRNTRTGKMEYKRLYKREVDYNAQRLARTLAQHTYQQSFIATTKDNPFIIDYIWHSNGSRPCELCQARNGMHFKKDELPMDHPNGMCVIEPAVVDDMVDQLADWFNNPDGTYPEIDEFAGNFGYEIRPIASMGKIYKRDLQAFDLLYNLHEGVYNSLSREEQSAIKKYMSFAGIDENYKGKALLDEAVSKATLPDNMILRRGVSDMPTNLNDALKMVGKEIGTTIEGKPISTTISSLTNFGTSTIEIRADQGTRGMFVDVARQSKKARMVTEKARKEGKLVGESEVLLPSTTVIEITGVHVDEKTKRIVYEAILRQR